MANFCPSEDGAIKFKSIIGNSISTGFRIKLTYAYSCSFKRNECIRLENTSGIMNNVITWNKEMKNPIVYVADSLNSSIKYYKAIKNKEKYTLEYINEYKVSYFLDNLTFSINENRIYIGFMASRGEYFKLASFIEKYKKLPEITDNTQTHSGSGYIDLSTGNFQLMNFNTLIRGDQLEFEQIIIYIMDLGEMMQ